MASRPLPLPIWDRQARKRISEFMEDSQSTYESRPRRSLNQLLESHPLYDWMLAAYQNSHRSARKIEPFIRKHNIDMLEFEPVQYRSYADFFERRFRSGVLRFPSDHDTMGAFAEARYLGWARVREDQQFPVKRASLNAAQILGGAQLGRAFADGPVLLARLAPVDYHHVHYFDDGETHHHGWEGHRLWTVNWRALQNKPDILLRNERRINILKTQNFGEVGFGEVGALSVGRILQVHPLGQPFRRGEEKSVFRFGGSAIVIFGEAGAWRPADDILQNTSESVETLVRLGDEIARRSSASRK